MISDTRSQGYEDLQTCEDTSPKHETSPFFQRSQDFFPQKTLFQVDKEIFIDPAHTLTLVNDTTFQRPLPPEFDERRSLDFVRASSPLFKKSASLRKPASLRKQCTLSESELPGQRVSISTFQGFYPRQKSILPQEEVDIFNPKEKEREVPRLLKVLFRKKLNSVSFNLFMGLVTIYSLLAEDLATVIFTKSADVGFDIVSLLVLVAFITEILLSIYAVKDYRFSLLFWLDLVSAVSIIIDINFILEKALYSDSNLDISFQNLKLSSGSGSIATKITQVLRIIRLVRLIKCYRQIMIAYSAAGTKKTPRNIQKIYPERSEIMLLKPDLCKESVSTDRNLNQQTRLSYMKESFVTLPLFGGEISYIKEKNDKSRETSFKNSEDRFRKAFEQCQFNTDTSVEKTNRTSRLSTSMIKVDNQQQNSKELRVGKKLEYLTTKRTIMIVSLLMLVSPFISEDLYYDSPSSHIYQTALLGSLMDSGSSDTAKQIALENYIQQFKEQNEFQLIYFRVGNTVLYTLADFDMGEVRRSEDQTITLSTKSRGEIVSKLSFRRYRQLEALIHITRTLFMFILLTLATIIFHKDIKHLLLIPLERMISKINQIANDPLLSKQETFVRDPNPEFKNEAIHIENAIIKIGGLLALGFGEAGSSIITHNITTSGDIDPMLPGIKKAAIYGFCDIRNFTDVTEILQEDIMIFVNSIADIVHSTVDKYGGAANKNIGDAFLIVWRFPEEAAVEIDEGKVQIVKSKAVESFVDCALVSFLKIYARVNRDPTLLEYSNDPCLNARLPNYRVKMGFGLHIGWSIEGAIGSNAKIDVSYLSPHVNMASRLEAVTKQYGVPLLFSGELFDMLSDSLQESSRIVDVVTVKGSANPIELYTVDLDVDGIAPSKLKTSLSVGQRREKHKIKKDYIRSITESGLTYTLLETDKELKHMLRSKNREFDDLFHVGFSAYIDGEWSTAKKNFDACLAIKGDDGPSRNLNTVMAEYDYIAPEDWRGHRVLTEK